MNNLKWVACFLKSRMNWIFWILFLNLLMLGISLIDYDFPIDSLFYIVSLNLSLTMIFLILTYFKEVKLYKHFDKDKEIEEIKHKDLAETPFNVIQLIIYIVKSQRTKKRLLSNSYN